MNHHFFKTIMVGALAATLILGGVGCKKSPSVVNVSDISLSEESLELKIGETKQLDVSFYPENANKHPELVWESDNDKIVTVSQEGLVTAMGSGKTVVTARTSDGSLWGTCKVRVITKVTAWALSFPDDRIWGGAAYDFIIKLTSTPSTAVAADFIWDVFDDNKDIISITLWEDHRAVYVRPLADGECQLAVTPKDGYNSKTIHLKAYKRRFAVIPNADGADFNGDGIEDGATIDMSKVKEYNGKPAIFIKTKGFAHIDPVEVFEITVEDKGIVKVAEIKKFRHTNSSLWVQLPLGTGSGTAKLTVKNKDITIDGRVLNTYTREFTLLVP